ncbi:AMP deaminase, partial [Massospora cicadina]
YSAAAQIWKLSATDMCEISRNSVLMSGFEYNVKKLWLGQHFDRPGVAGNNMEKTNVPNLRIAYRYETLMEEVNMVRHFNVPDPQPGAAMLSQPNDFSLDAASGDGGSTLFSPGSLLNANVGASAAVYAPDLLPQPNKAIQRKLHIDSHAVTSDE